MQEFIEKIVTVCLACHGSITSWIRSHKHNQDVGGTSFSLHLLGMAVDVVFDSNKDKEKAKHYIERLGLRGIDESDHLHIQIK